MSILPGSKINILHVILTLRVAGAEKLVFDMIKRTDRKKYKPSVCCLDLIGSLGEKLIEDGFKVHLIERGGGIDFSVVGKLKKIIREDKIDVIHAHQYTPFFYSLLSSLFANVKIIFTEHGRFYPEQRRIKKMLFNPILAFFSDHIVSISEATKKAMVKYDNFPANKIKVIWNGAIINKADISINKSERKKSLGIDDGSSIIGMAARLEKIKNFPMALRVFKSVLQTKPDTWLIIAGQGPIEEELKNISRELGISKRVKFLGLRMDLPEIYPLFDIFWLTSFTEGISITLIEAMTSGIPVVVTNVGGNSEVVVHEETGCLIDIGDESTMTKKTLDILNDTSKAKLLGHNGSLRAKEYFSFDVMMERYNELYEN